MNQKIKRFDNEMDFYNYVHILGNNNIRYYGVKFFEHDDDSPQIYLISPVDELVSQMNSRRLNDWGKYKEIIVNYIQMILPSITPIPGFFECLPGHFHYITDKEKRWQCRFYAHEIHLILRCGGIADNSI